MKRRFLALIPARGGSKGIKDKNVVGLCGKPLISYSIECALNSNYIDRIIVSTDSVNIAETSKKYNAEVPFIRPDNLASDTSKSLDVILHCIDYLSKKGDYYDYIVLLQPTQPLRKAFHIDEAIELILSKNEDSLLSVRKVFDNPILIKKVDKNFIAKNLIDTCSTRRRQDFSDYYKVNGSIYINKISSIDENTSLNDNKLCYIMDDMYDIDIDELFDLEVAELKIKFYNL